MNLKEIDKILSRLKAPELILIFILFLIALVFIFALESHGIHLPFEYFDELLAVIVFLSIFLILIYMIRKDSETRESNGDTQKSEGKTLPKNRL